MSKVVAAIAESCSTSYVMYRKIGSSIIGCHCHRFNPAVEDMLGNHSNWINIVQQVIKANASNTCSKTLMTYAYECDPGECHPLHFNLQNDSALI